MQENKYKMLRDFLVGAFTVDEVRNFLAFDLPAGAALQHQLPDGGEVPRMLYMSALVDLLRRTGLHDHDFFTSLHRARPRLRVKVEELQRHFSAEALPLAVEHVLDIESTMSPGEIDERNAWWDAFDVMVHELGPARRFEIQRLNSQNYLERFGLSVGELKTHLRALGYYSGSIDDNFDEGVATAIETLQRRHNMRHIDGICGELTLEKIFGLLGRGQR